MRYFAVIIMFMASVCCWGQGAQMPPPNGKKPPVEGNRPPMEEGQGAPAIGSDLPRTDSTSTKPAEKRTGKLEERKMIDGVVWVVGDEAILRSEVEQERLRAQYEGAQVKGDPYCLIPENLAIQKLFIHQAKIDSIEANNGQVEMQVNAQISYFLREIGSKEKMEEYFKKPLEEIKAQMRKAVEEQSLMQQVQASLTQNINVTPSEVRRYYNSLSEDSIPMIAAQMEVQVITTEPPIPKEAIEETKQRLRDMADRVNRGEIDFSVLARLYSEDEGTARRGGELGFMGRGALVQEFADAAFALTEPGKVSRVVETEFGYHIIQLIERRDDRVNCRHILLRPHVTADMKVSALEHLDTLAKDIRMGKLAFEQAAELFSSDKETKMNGGTMSNSSNGSSRFELQELPTEIAKQVVNMKEGDVSDAFSMFSEKLNHEVYVIVRLTHKIQNHKANLNEDYQMIQSMCESAMKQTVIEKWLRNKIKETYVYISPEWRDCEYNYSEWKR